MTNVSPTGSTSQPLLSPSRPTTLLTPGQNLQANVERILPNGEAELRIGSTLLRVNTPINLAVGQPLSLSVELTDQGLLLRVKQETQQLETLANAWRSAIPKQKPLAEVLSQLQQILKQTSSEQLPTSLRRSIDTLIQQTPKLNDISKADGLRHILQQSGTQLEARLLRTSLNQQALNTSQDLKANFLRIAQQVLQWQSQQGAISSNIVSTNTSSIPATNKTGLELYHALLNATNNKSQNLPLSARPLLPPLTNLNTNIAPENRLFTSLQQILNRIFPSSFTTHVALPSTHAAATKLANINAGQALLRISAEILNQLESGLARIQHHQLTAMPNDDPVRTLLNTELAVLHNQQLRNIGIRIEQEDGQQQEQESEHIWRAVISFDLPKLGKVQAIISIQQQQIHTEFRSENNIATTLFRQHIGLLQERLMELGIKTGEFHFNTGAPMVDINNPASSALLHTKA